MSRYKYLLNGPAYFPIRQPGYLHLAGTDRLSFLQRQTTNDLSLLAQDGALLTVLTNAAARILDVLTLFNDGDALAVLTLPGYGNQTANYLRNRVFFRDQVTLFDLSPDFIQVDLIGPETGTILDLPNLDLPPAVETTSVTELAGVPARMIGMRDWGWRLIIPAAEAHRFGSELEARGAVLLSEEEYNIIRVESGRPAAGHELTDAYTPLEIGLDYAISNTKGCYTGQEVIARQITYDKITRKLVGIYFEGKASDGDSVKAADTDQIIGKVTSVVDSPRHGWIGLAVLKRPYEQPGTLVLIESQTKVVSGRVSPLPFPIHR